jgi:hypothetical protein
VQGVGFGFLVAGIAGSNAAEGINICVLCLYVVLLCVGRGFCDELIPRPEESYQLPNKIQKPRKGIRNVDRCSNPKKSVHSPVVVVHG